MPLALAIDLGGTKVEAALVDETGALVEGSRHRHPTGAAAATDVAVLRNALETVIAGCRTHPRWREVGAAGIARIASYVGGAPSVSSWAQATAYAKAINGEALPHLTDADWERFARRVFRDDHGVFSLDYDPAISQGFKSAAPASDGAAPAGAPDLWPLFNALAADRPLLLVRGETSDILDADIAGKMSTAAPHMARVEIPNMGHAPTLEEPEAIAAITTFFAQAA